jgi:hypothetical protein
MPPLRYLKSDLRQWESDQSELLQRCEDREDGCADDHRACIHQPTEQAEQCAHERGRGERREREGREGEAVPVAAPAHGGGDRLDHRESSGGPGTRHPGEERRRADSGLDQQGSLVS